MKISGIIFDFDGTLADTLPVCFIAYRKVFARYIDKQVTDEEIAQFFGPSEEGVIRNAVGEDCADAVEMYLREYESAHGFCAEPFPGITDALEAICDLGIRMSLVTGKGPRSLAISFAKMPLRDYFDTVATGGLLTNTKAESIAAAAVHWNFDPSTVAYIGDSPSDIQQSRLAGAIPLAAAWSPKLERGRAALEAEDPEAIFDAPAELVEWMKRRQGE